MKDIACSRCNAYMTLINQFPVKGVNTFEFTCGRCSGKAHLQLARNPQTGKTMARQIRLTGGIDEYRPNSIKNNEQFEIEAISYSNASAGRRIGAGLEVQPAYKLTQGNQVIHPEDPMHPANLRQRLMGAPQNF